MIALVVTIIVLVILAAITIYQVTTHNLIGNATDAKEENRKSSATEIINMKILNLQIKGVAKNDRLPDLQELANGLCDDEEIAYVIKKDSEVASLTYIDVGDSKSIFTKLKEYPYEFEINRSLRIASINGV